MEDERIKELFSACDLDGSGYIEEQELASICSELSPEEVRKVLSHLDNDGDGKISLKEFSQGFEDINETLMAITRQRRKERMSSVSTSSLGSREKDETSEWAGNLGEGFSLLSCQEQVCDLYQLLNQLDLHHMVALFENVILAVVRDIKQLQNESQRVESSYKREKDLHAAHMRQMEEEMEAQVQRMETRVRAEEREHSEAAKEELRRQLESEIHDLSANLKRLQSMGSQEKIHKTASNDLKSRVDELSSETRQLRSQLTDTQTNLALARSELTTLRQHYDEKCHELEGERSTLVEYITEQENLARQIQLLIEVNKNLQDNNDDLRAELENTRATNKRPYNRNRTRMRSAEILRQYFMESSPISTISRNSSLADEFYLTAADPFRRHVLPTQESYEVDSIQEDIDSGRSTMRGDIREADSEYEPNSLADDDNASIASSRKRQRRNNVDDSMSEAMESGEEMELGADEDEVDGYPVQRPASTTSEASSRQGIIRRRNVNIPQVVKGEPERMYKVVLAGDAAVGKSSFIMRLCKNKFMSNLHSTLGVDFQTKVIEVDGRVIALQLWDTAGQERFRSIAKSYFRRADGVLLLYDTTYERSFLNVRDWTEAIEESAPQKIPIMLCGNKTDLREEMERKGEGKTVVKTEDGQKLAKQFEGLFIETSAKDGSNIYEACIELARMLRTNEDIEVQAVGLTINDMKTEKKKQCC